MIGNITISRTGVSPVTFAPADYKITFDSLAGPDSGRSIDGTMHINWILKKTTKLEVTLPPHKYNDPDWAKILAIVQGQDALQVTFYDYMSHTTVPHTMYCSQSNAGYYYKGLVNDVSFELMEMKGE